MDIGSAKITKEEMQGIKHYLVDEFEPDEEFHVVKFVERAKEHLEEIVCRGKNPDHCRRHRILYSGTSL